MNKVIDKGFRSCRFVSTIVKHPVHIALCTVVLRSNTICAYTLTYMLATHGTTCAAHCNCWFIM